MSQLTKSVSASVRASWRTQAANNTPLSTNVANSRIMRLADTLDRRDSTLAEAVMFENVLHTKTEQQGKFYERLAEAHNAFVNHVSQGHMEIFKKAQVFFKWILVLMLATITFLVLTFFLAKDLKAGELTQGQQETYTNVYYNATYKVQSVQITKPGGWGDVWRLEALLVNGHGDPLLVVKSLRRNPDAEYILRFVPSQRTPTISMGMEP